MTGKIDREGARALIPWRRHVLGLIAIVLAVTACGGSDDADAGDLRRADDPATEQAVAAESDEEAGLEFDDEFDFDEADFDFASVIDNIGLSAADTPLEVRLAAASTEFLQVEESQLSTVFADYEAFLTARDAARRGGEAEMSELLALTTSSVVLDEVEVTRTDFTASREIGLELDEYVNVPHPIEIVGDGEQIEIHDCLEERVASRVAGLGTTNFVEQLVVLQPDATGTWIVTDLEQVHSGFWEDRAGCTPPSYVGQIIQAADDFLYYNDLLMREPEANLQGLDVATDLEMFVEVGELIERMRESGVHLPQPQEHRLDLIGSHPGYGSTWFLVATCTYLPQGLAPVYRDTGTLVPPEEGGYAISAGNMYRELLVLLETDEFDTIRGKVVGIDDQVIDSDCTVPQQG
ncbi:MAG: hypothetical protein AAF467_17285 [Actinomycetota bacterium]